MFGMAVDFGGGECGVFVEPRKVGGKAPRDETTLVISREETEKLCKIGSTRRHEGGSPRAEEKTCGGETLAVDGKRSDFCSCFSWGKRRGPPIVR